MRPGAVVLVHGFTGGPENWDQLISLLQQDPEVVDRFEFFRYTYPTKLVELGLHRRIPALSELGNSLGEYLDSSDFYDREITLVGHSQGGLIIQQFLADMVQQGRGLELRWIRQVLLFAPPLEGSVFLSGPRRLIFSLFQNPQERALRVLAKETGEAQRTVRQRIAGAKTVGPDECPIPIHCFWGLQDRIVLPESAQGSYYGGSAIPGEHSTVIKPVDASDERYKEFKEALLYPRGHPSIFEIDTYQLSISVKPLPPGTKVTCKYQFGTRTIRTGTKGVVQQEVAFARRNQCRDPFTLRYGTEERGAIQANASHPNEAPASELQTYERDGSRYVFQFRPQPGEKYWLQAVAYKAFDKGNEDLHRHLGKDSRYRRFTIQLDLSPYFQAGHGLEEPPVLHLRRSDPGDHSDCAALAVGDVIPPIAGTSLGVWRWEMENLQEGVVDLRWHHTLSEPPSSKAGGPKPAPTELG